MPDTVLPIEFRAASGFGPAQMMLDRAKQYFRRSRHTISHTLRIGSGCGPVDSFQLGRRTRSVPCTWGARQDVYRWSASRASRAGGDYAALHRGASAMGWALVHAPLPAWQELLPGSMTQMMGRHSDLYLADYWMLTLHCLVWSGRLPYPIKARWVRGTSIHDPLFEFVSELPTGVAEASLDALILFRESAVIAAGFNEASIEPARVLGLPSLEAVEPPVCRDGRWYVGACRQALAQTAEPETAVPRQPALAEAQRAPEPQAQAVDLPAEMLELDDQTFMARFGASSFRFAPRNKQVFALLERISRRPDHRVTFDDLRATGDVWDGLNVEDCTIRGAVARLRKLLRGNRMEAVADRILTGTYQGRAYVVLRADGQSDA